MARNPSGDFQAPPRTRPKRPQTSSHSASASSRDLRRASTRRRVSKSAPRRPACRARGPGPSPRAALSGCVSKVRWACSSQITAGTSSSRVFSV
uniref:Uncharacterized protein n=1 Tax=Human herpesvirus 2 TaxID=10310 RepID=A0A481T8C4_HHV2|nr:hypothetical protein [Human alphaherpesvirus 2]QBH77212.1 hypothetical protein [Human alphaherpesvirus 2]QBH78519.1 hypothetical protein [Human alphaherpesvirus 2]QBH78791.1 hypothetical protein [Human alphaherpesvirus 2]QBH79309.1 hypothetical protein [Human alphaherpesvirus 2]